MSATQRTRPGAKPNAKPGLASFLESNGLTLLDHHGWALDAGLAARACSIRLSCSADGVEAPQYAVAEDERIRLATNLFTSEFQEELEAHREGGRAALDLEEGRFAFKAGMRSTTVSWDHPRRHLAPGMGMPGPETWRRPGLPHAVGTRTHGGTTVSICGSTRRTLAWMGVARRVGEVATDMGVATDLALMAKAGHPLILNVAQDMTDMCAGGMDATAWTGSGLWTAADWVDEAVQVIEANLQCAGVSGTAILVDMPAPRRSSAALSASARTTLPARRLALARALLAGGARADGPIAAVAAMGAGR